MECFGEKLAEGNCTYSDITHFMAWLLANESYAITFENMLSMATGRAIFLCHSKWAQYALEMFPGCFMSARSFYDEREAIDLKVGMQRRPLYVYQSRSVYDAIVDLSEDADNFFFVSFSWIQTNPREFAQKTANSANEVLVDLTAFAATSNSQALIALDSICSSTPSNLFFLVRESDSDRLYEEFPSLFDTIENITMRYPNLVKEDTSSCGAPKSVCSLTSEGLNSFFMCFRERLAGHENFKNELQRRIESFSVSHRLRDQHVFSLFLFGESGVGKTEVARLICDILEPGSRLPKVNFESYSSQDSLNSLIGSPAGYIGCESGELNDKLDKSQVKVLLCDEFEKTNAGVQNFFLELLEEGFYTDRMGKEHNLDGYIIVFTSNIKNESDLNIKISPELRNRLDLICEFVQPSIHEKALHVERYAAEKARHYEDGLGLSKKIDISDIVFASEELSRFSIREINKIISTKIASQAVELLNAKSDDLT